VCNINFYSRAVCWQFSLSTHFTVFFFLVQLDITLSLIAPKFWIFLCNHSLFWNASILVLKCPMYGQPCTVTWFMYLLSLIGLSNMPVKIVISNFWQWEFSLLLCSDVLCNSIINYWNCGAHMHNISENLNWPPSQLGLNGICDRNSWHMKRSLCLVQFEPMGGPQTNEPLLLQVRRCISFDLLSFGMTLFKISLNWGSL